jgi:lipopolysaccharide/colanic/teichoic acid biosynthesis glycosyltransferase
VYSWRFGLLPAASRGPIALVLAWLAVHYLLGTYTALARRQLTAGRQLRNCLAAAVLVFSLAAAVTMLRGEILQSTMSRSFLLPVLALGFLTNQLLRISQLTSHLWQPQEQWLLIASQSERAALTRAMDFGGCAIPCGIEWRSSGRMPPLPPPLADLLQLDGVAIGSELDPARHDREVMLAWQQAGVRLLSIRGWSEHFLRRLPPELVPDSWSERVEGFSHARAGPTSRLKRLGDLVLSGMMALVLIPLLAVADLLCSAPILHQDLCSGRDGQPFLRQRFAAAGPLSALPQWRNVWRGEMSLVGPRPLSMEVMAELEQRFPGAELRQWMRPGMTGWGRIAGPPPEESDAIAWELGRDLYYLRNHSLLLDLQLLLTSLLRLFSRLLVGPPGRGRADLRSVGPLPRSLP